MQPLVSAIEPGTVQIWAAALLMAAASVPVPRRQPESRHVELNHHTLKDIGVEPGSITWI